MAIDMVFWQPCATIHLSSFFRSLAIEHKKDGSIYCILEAGLPPERKAQGWSEQSYGDVVVIDKRDSSRVNALIEKTEQSDYHFFSGLVSSAWMREMFEIILERGAKLGVVSESRDVNGFKGKLRWIHSLIFEQRVRSNVDLVFAMGELGVEWHKSIGYESSTLFPFAYCVEERSSGKQSQTSAVLKLAYVGELDANKNVALLIQAISQIEGDLELLIVGDGPEKARLGCMSQDDKRISFAGFMKNADVRDLLCEVDCLVLPSHYDGWGAVVNEALLAGARVVVSDNCGACCLIDHAHNGYVFRAGNLSSLIESLRAIVKHGKVKEATRESIVSSGEKVTGEELARYFLQVIKEDSGIRVLPPWSR